MAEFVVRYAGKRVIECSGVVPWIADIAEANGQRREIRRMACFCDGRPNPYTVFELYLPFSEKVAVGDVIKFDMTEYAWQSHPK
jgi:hypothetical protein